MSQEKDAARSDFNQLHARIVLGDAIAREELSQLLLPEIVRYLGRRRPYCDHASLHDASEDALLAYFKHPDSFLESRSPLDRFLKLAALNNLRDILRSRKRRLDREILMGAELPELPPDLHDPISRWREMRLVFRSAQTDRERNFLRAKFRGERRAEALAEILGLHDCSVDKQRSEVNRVWTKLRLRILRERRRT